MIPYVAACQLRQSPLDFIGNRERILKSIHLAHLAGADYRVGPHNEICGPDLGNHLFELDTHLACWKSLAVILQNAENILFIDIGMPVLSSNRIYEARIIIENRKIETIVLGPEAYVEIPPRNQNSFLEIDFEQESNLAQVYISRLCQHECFADSFSVKKASYLSLDFNNYTSRNVHYVWKTPFGPCSKKENPLEGRSPSDLKHALIVDACSYEYELVSTSEAADHSLLQPYAPLSSTVIKCGFHGNCSGLRYYDGITCILTHGCRKFAPKHTLHGVNVVVTNKISRNAVSPGEKNDPTLSKEDASKFSPEDSILVKQCVTDSSVETSELIIEKELMNVISSWLWSYLVKSGAKGFFLPLSGGIDSAAVLACVVYMCRRVVEERDLPEIQDQLRNVLRKSPDDFEFPEDPTEIVGHILTTAYLKSAVSSSTTQRFSSALAEQAGTKHYQVKIDPIVDAFQRVLPDRPAAFEADGGPRAEDMALQNLQARIRMVLSYFLAGITAYRTSDEGDDGIPTLLVLGTGNYDESFLGYFTKYDCSSADLNPIGTLTKVQLKAMLSWAADELELPILKEIVCSTPSAELKPEANGSDHQSDEADLGLTYSDIDSLHHACKGLGPGQACKELALRWGSPKAKQACSTYFDRFTRHRHKMFVATPTLHLTPNDCSPYSLADPAIFLPSTQERAEALGKLLDK